MPPVEEQRQFFHYAAMEAQEVSPPRIVRGPYFDKYTDVMSTINEGLKAIDDSYTVEYLFPYSYQSPEVQRHFKLISPEDRLALDALVTKKKNIMNAVSRSMRLEIKDQTMQGLAVPPYHSQEEDWRDYERLQGCENACFRMIFEDIAGWAPSQAALSESMRDLHGTSVLDGGEYYNLLRTDAFSEVSAAKVSSFEVIGADFDFLSSLTEKIKSKKSDARVYSVINLRSDRPSHRSVIHAVVLHSADGKRVTYHDPKGSIRGESTTCAQSDFIDRWTTAYNKARIVVAA